MKPFNLAPITFATGQDAGAGAASHRPKSPFPEPRLSGDHPISGTLLRVIGQLASKSEFGLKSSSQEGFSVSTTPTG